MQKPDCFRLAVSRNLMDAAVLKWSPKQAS